MKVGMIGLGVVGNATAKGLSHNGKIEVIGYDKYKACDSSLRDVAECEVIFICVPTPMKMSGEIDISALFDSVASLIKAGTVEDTIIVIKSTAVSGTTDGFASRLPHLRFAFNPEFLTEANAEDDFLKSDRIIIGANDNNVFDRLKSIYQEAGFTCPIIHTDIKTAEMIKYVGNTFLATKVMFANQIYQICKHLNLDYNEVIRCVKLDQRIGKTHWGVPGPDSELGFGGKCFPKDLNALIYFAKEKGCNANLLREVWRSNLDVREKIDWLKELENGAI